LVFIEDGNKDQINGLINFDKSRKISLVIREIQQYQQTPYCITKVPEIQVFSFFFSFLSFSYSNSYPQLTGSSFVQ